VTPDPVTKLWVRNAADERAAAAGCTFDPERGLWVVDWIERLCRLYEGEQAGQPLILRGCFRCGDSAEARAAYPDCVKAGHPRDWQFDFVMRLFSWVRHSERWNRLVRRFREASGWMPKKSKKSPTLAALGLYLLCGDGEPGQKVFLAAKDGNQARKIAGEHAVAMLEQSPALLAECRLNRNTYRITHTPSRSWLEPMSSSNARTQQAKEGINGCVLIDETHVVDRELIQRISRAGISRSEPLRVEVSTAGNDPDGYGKERFDYAKDVAAGVRHDEQLFVMTHAAPQDLSDTDLDADPLKWGRVANPAMGHTIDPEEYLRDYQTSRRSIQALLDFKMYRLNIWQRSANPWLRAGDWERCRRAFTEADLAGKECWAGLDLSRTRDLSALVLVFRGEAEEEFLLLPYFWLPETRARELESVTPVLEWRHAGAVEVTPGDVTDYGYIRSRFRKLAAVYDIRELAYDPRFAEETTQALSEGVTDDAGKMIEEGTGVERFIFAQSDENFAAATEDYERLVIAGKLLHNGHPVQSWQAGHATVIMTPRRVKRVMKPKKDSVQTVDGVIAGIMALARAVKAVPVAGGCEAW
jgi:phage terminase large subunit-like protein